MSWRSTIGLVCLSIRPSVIPKWAISSVASIIFTTTGGSISVFPNLPLSVRAMDVALGFRDGGTGMITTFSGVIWIKWGSMWVKVFGLGLNIYIGFGTVFSYPGVIRVKCTIRSGHLGLMDSMVWGMV